MPEARDIDPAAIEPSPNNPRLVFDTRDQDRLRESIDEVGILVPLTVYEVDEGRYRLIDGERRLRCALELGLDTVPCYVVDGVGEPEELEWMFSIHMMREEWEDGPVASALKALSDELGGWDDEKMKAVTGLSSQRLSYFRALAESPPEILQRVIDGELPPNLVADSVLRVARPLRNELPDLAEGKQDEEFIRQMVAKRDAGALPDVVDLRNLRTMIRVASEEVDSDREVEEIKNRIREVISNPNSSIEEAYEDTVSTRVAYDGFLTAIDRFKKSAAHVASELDGDAEAVTSFTQQIEGLIDDLRELVDRLRER